MRFLIILTCLWQEFLQMFSDDEEFDPGWMDETAWQISRL